MSEVKVSFISSSEKLFGPINESWNSMASEGVGSSLILSVISEAESAGIDDAVDTIIENRRGLGFKRCFRGYDLFEIERHHLRMALQRHYRKIFAVTKILNEHSVQSVNQVSLIGRNPELAGIVDSYFGNSKAESHLSNRWPILVCFVSVLIMGFGNWFRLLVLAFKKPDDPYSCAFFNMPVTRYSPLLKEGDVRGFGFLAQGGRQLKEYRQFRISDSLKRWYRLRDIVPCLKLVGRTRLFLRDFLAIEEVWGAHRFCGVNVIQSFSKQWGGYFFRRHFQYAFELLALERWAKDSKISRLVLWNDELASEKCLLLISKKLDIDTYVVLHAAYEGCFATDRSLIDYYIVWGELTREIFVDAGYDFDRVLPLGSVQFDEHYRKKEALSDKGRSNTCEELNLEVESRYILCPMLPGPDELAKTSFKNGAEMDYLNLVISAVEEHPEFRLLLKCRNSSDLTYFKNQLELIGSSVVCEFFDSTPIPPLLAVAEMVISYPSTIVVESLLMDRSTIVVGMEDIEIKTPYVEYEAVVLVDSSDALSTAIGDIEKNPEKSKSEAAKFLSDFVGEFDGNRAKAVISSITGEV